MGTSLHVLHEGPYGEPVRECIWGDNIALLTRTLTRDPSLLSNEQVYPGEVIRDLRLIWGKRIRIYEDLLQFCRSPTGLSLSEQNFRTFPYDWRRDNRLTAHRLEQFCSQILAEDADARFVFLAHSMGNIVVRLMLLNSPALRSRCDCLVQVGSAVKGSARAFLTLQDRRCFDGMLDHVIRNLTSDRERIRLLDTLRGFPSLYQLLPPRELHLLRRADGLEFSATDPSIWPKERTGMIAAADSVHALLARDVEVPTFALYSGSLETHQGYLVDQYFRVLRHHTGQGDGTVTCYSASFGVQLPNRHAVPKANHQSLCYSPRALGALREKWASWTSTKSIS